MLHIINPRQTVLVTTSAKIEHFGKEVEKDNIITLDWHMPLSKEPVMYAIAIGKTRFSCKLLQKSGVFAVNFIPFSWKDKAIFCGRNSGIHIDKFKEANLEKEECNSIECIRIKNSIGYLECVVEQEIEVGDHIVFIARVTHSGKFNKEKRLFHMEKNEFTTTLE